MPKKTKVKTKQKTQTKQKQKQHQKQTVIVNVNTKKSTRSRSKDNTSKKESQPLITTLPIQYTPQTMYDLSNTRTRDADARYINQPEIPNAIPVMDIQIPSTTQPIAPPIAVAVATPLPLPLPLQKYGGITAAGGGITAGKDTGDNYVETQDEEDERMFQLKLQSAINMSYPTQQTTLRNAQSGFRRSQIPRRKENSKRKINEDDDDTITNGAPKKRYHCQICGSKITDNPASIRIHNRTLKHRNAEARLLNNQFRTPERQPIKNGNDSDTSVNSIMSPAFIPPPPPSESEAEQPNEPFNIKIKKKRSSKK